MNFVQSTRRCRGKEKNKVTCIGSSWQPVSSLHAALGGGEKKKSDFHMEQLTTTAHFAHTTRRWGVKKKKGGTRMVMEELKKQCALHFFLAVVQGVVPMASMVLYPTLWCM